MCFYIAELVEGARGDNGLEENVCSPALGFSEEVVVNLVDGLQRNRACFKIKTGDIGRMQGRICGACW